MLTNTSFIQRYRVAIFCVLTILFSFGAYLLPIPKETVPFIMVLVPAVIAILLAGLTKGRAGVRTLIGMLGQWRVNLKWLLVALGVALALRLVISLLALVLGWIPAIRLRPLSPIEIVMFALIFIVAAIPEELGWRGFALKEFLKERSPLYASLVLGVLWGAIHLALHLPGMPNASTPMLLTMLQLVGLSVLLTWLFIRGGYNILLTIFFHAAQSFFVVLNEGVSLEQQGWLMAFVWCGAAILVILLDRSMRVRSLQP
jgi:uncharacterized protein